MNEEHWSVEEMSDAMLAYIEFAANVANAMKDYARSKDVEKMVASITAAGERLDKRTEQYKIGG